MRGTLPHQLRQLINDENVEFASFANRVASWKTIFGNVVIALIFGGMGLFVLNVETNSFRFDYYFEDGKEVHFWEIISSYNWGLLAFGVLFSLVGVLLLFSAIRLTFSKVGCFVGTPTRLIHYKNGTVKIYVWELFTDEIKTDVQRGNVRFTLRTGDFQGSKNPIFVPDKIEIIAADNPAKIERVARERIRSCSQPIK